MTRHRVFVEWKSFVTKLETMFFHQLIMSLAKCHRLDVWTSNSSHMANEGQTQVCQHDLTKASLLWPHPKQMPPLQIPSLLGLGLQHRGQSQFSPLHYPCF